MPIISMVLSSAAFQEEKLVHNRESMGFESQWGGRRPVGRSSVLPVASILWPGDPVIYHRQ